MIFSKTIEALRNRSNAKNNALNFDVYSLKAQLTSMLDSTLLDSRSVVEIEVLDLNSFVEIADSVEITEKYDVEQSKEDASVFRFRLKDMDYTMT